MSQVRNVGGLLLLFFELMNDVIEFEEIQPRTSLETSFSRRWSEHFFNRTLQNIFIILEK